MLVGSARTHYILLDAVVAPPEARGAFSEARVYLPHTYQGNDYELGAAVCVRGGAECAAARAELLGATFTPAGAVVFADFNAAHKIEPGVFGVWMDVLTRVRGSVLLLIRVRRRVRGGLLLQLHHRQI